MIFAIALAVGAIPEGLPAIVTIALAIGVQRMARRNAIIRKLPPVETLGSTTVICTDKTGTLTRNEMTVVEMWTSGRQVRLTGIGYNPVGYLHHDGSPVDAVPDSIKQLLIDGALCNDASIHYSGGLWNISGDPTEAALLVAAEKIKIDTADEKVRQPRLDVIPFEFEVKEPNLMLRPPRDPRAPLFSGFVLFRTVFVSIVMTAGMLLLFKWEYRHVCVMRLIYFSCDSV
jgi:Ca2+-transporting ATPase